MTPPAGQVVGDEQREKRPTGRRVGGPRRRRRRRRRHENEIVATSLADGVGTVAAGVVCASAGARAFRVAASDSTTAAARRQPLGRSLSPSPPRPPAVPPRKIEAVSVDRRARARASRAPFGRRPKSPGVDVDTNAGRLCGAARALRATALRPPVDSTPERQRVHSPPTTPTCLRPPDRPRLTSRPLVPSTRLQRKMRRWRAPLRSGPVRARRAAESSATLGTELARHKKSANHEREIRGNLAVDRQIINHSQRSDNVVRERHVTISRDYIHRYGAIASPRCPSCPRGCPSPPPPRSRRGPPAPRSRRDRP